MQTAVRRARQYDCWEKWVFNDEARVVWKLLELGLLANNVRA
jgi:hypothetical protein